MHPSLIIERADGRMSQVLEEPEQTCGTEPGVVFVDNDRTIGRDTSQREEVPDHPHEGPQRRLARVNQAHAPEVEVHGATNLPTRELLGGASVDHKWRRGARESPVQLIGRDQKIGFSHA